MPHVKGTAINARLRYVRDHHGDAGLARVLDALAPESRALIEARVLPQAWAPYDLFVDLCVQIDRLFGRGDLETCIEMGRYSAEVNLPTLYRLFYKLGSPMFILRKAAGLWSVHYDSGALSAVADSATAARLRILGFEQPHKAHCRSVLGWALKSVELSGGTIDAFAEEKCRTRGDALCEMSVRWH